jgi:hypothetical protein
MNSIFNSFATMLVEKVEEALAEFRSGSRSDDTAILALRRHPG